MNSQYVVFHKETLKILALGGDAQKLTAEEYIRTKQKSLTAKYPIEELDAIPTTKEFLDEVMDSAGRYIMVIDPQLRKVKYHLAKEQSRNSTYNDREIKREFTVSDIKKMYHEHYLNFNLKNFIKSNNLKCGFVPLKDIQIRGSMMNMNWNYFHSDPYLQDSNFDKLNLGRNILERGTYWPIIVSPLSDDKPDSKYVFEGSHRIISLKLLQLEGEVPEDFTVFCIQYKNNYEMLQIEQRYIEFETPFRMRALMELVYGDEVINNEHVYKTAISTMKFDDTKLVDEFTIERTARNYDDGFISLQSYAHYLRDLIYANKDEIKPSIYLNDAEAYEEWINGSEL